MQVAHAGFAQAISNLETLWIQRARGTHLGGHLGAYRNQHRRYPLHFNFPLNRDDRPVAHAWSTTSQYDEVGARPFVNLVCNFAGRAFVHCFELHGVTHVAHVFPGDFANEPFCL